MKKFFEDTSSSRCLSNDNAIHQALKHFSEQNFHFFTVYAGDKLLSSFEDRESARVYKSFKEIEMGLHANIHIVAEYDYKFMARG